MNDQDAKPEPLWIDITHIDMPRNSWIWWVIEGTIDEPAAGSRSYNSLHALQAHIEERGYKAPTAAQINDVVLQARVDGKDEARLEIPLPKIKT